MCAVQQSGSPVSGPLLPKWPVQRSCPSPKRVSVLTSSLIKPTYAATELAFAQKNRATKRAVSPDMKAPRLEQPVALIPRKRGISCVVRARNRALKIVILSPIPRALPYRARGVTIVPPPERTRDSSVPRERCKKSSQVKSDPAVRSVG